MIKKGGPEAQGIIKKGGPEEETFVDPSLSRTHGAVGVRSVGEEMLWLEERLRLTPR